MFLAAALAIVTNSLVCSAFGTTRTTKSRIIGTLPSFSSPRKTFSLSVAGGGNVEIPGGAGQPPRMSKEEEDKVQWDLFMKHHARGKWRGTWTTYDYMGDVVDETLASVNLEADETGSAVMQTHQIVMGKATSDCKTCFDSEDVRTIPVASYTPGQLRKNRLAAAGMVTGPSLLRSGAMSTELILSYGDGRVRVIFQHAPVWARGVEPNSCPPAGLKLYRTIVCREALREEPPSFSSENENPPKRGNPKFFRPVPPFLWHKKWKGTSWTWGPSSGDRGWNVEEMDEADAWHGRPTGDAEDVWAMRIPGGILVQCPRIIQSGQLGLCRLAWLPEDDAPEGSEYDGDTSKLLRIEASISALEPVIDEENPDMMIGFYPPELGSLRCDVVQNFGDLENVSILGRDMAVESLRPKNNEVPAPPVTPAASSPPPTATEKEKQTPPPAPSSKKSSDASSSNSSGKESKKSSDGEDESDGLKAVRQALKF